MSPPPKINYPSIKIQDYTGTASPKVEKLLMSPKNDDLAEKLVTATQQDDKIEEKPDN